MWPSITPSISAYSNITSYTNFGSNYQVINYPSMYQQQMPIANTTTTTTASTYSVGGITVAGGLSLSSYYIISPSITFPQNVEDNKLLKFKQLWLRSLYLNSLKQTEKFYNLLNSELGGSLGYNHIYCA